MLLNILEIKKKLQFWFIHTANIQHCLDPERMTKGGMRYFTTQHGFVVFLLNIKSQGRSDDEMIGENICKIFVKSE